MSTSLSGFHFVDELAGLLDVQVFGPADAVALKELGQVSALVPCDRMKCFDLRLGSSPRRARLLPVAVAGC